MRKALHVLATLALSAAPALTSGADIVNGWSANATITKIHSLSTQTLFKLNTGSEGCGHVDHWSLPVDDSARSKAKLGMLLAAYVSGKGVALRCENSAVTDFQVFD